MAHKTSKDMGLKLDGPSGLVTLSGSVNSQSLETAVTILDDTGMGSTRHTTLPGLAAAIRIPLSGWVNTTTEGVFGPVAQGTSVTKTVNFQVHSGRHYTGEVWVENYTISGTPDTLLTWSATLVAENGLTRTSVAAS